MNGYQRTDGDTSTFQYFSGHFSTCPKNILVGTSQLNRDMCVESVVRQQEARVLLAQTHGAFFVKQGLVQSVNIVLQELQLRS